MATQTITRSRLETLVENFDRDTLSGRIRIRELMEHDPKGFQESVLQVLKSSTHSRGVHFVLSLLVSGDCLMPILGDPAFTMEQAIALARQAMQMDPMLDVNMAKRLADSVALGGGVANSDRLLEILGEISPGNRITCSLMRLLRTSDPELRSKVVLLIGRSNRSVKWVQSRLSDSDPRTRANAVEALWGLHTPEANELLRAAARDGNNRVAGNALYALYRMGDTWVFPELFKMATAESPMFRATAAWVMGETGDPRFSETLGKLVGEALPVVRKPAFTGLLWLKATGAKMRLGQEWRVVARVLSHSKANTKLRVEAGPMDGNPPPVLLPTQFILAADGQAVIRYNVADSAAVENLALTFFFPHPAYAEAASCIAGALACLPAKRPADFWRTMFYLPAREAREAESETAPFISGPEIIEAGLKKPPFRAECLPFWHSIRSAADGAGNPPRGTRHFIVLNESNTVTPAGLPEIVSAAMNSRSTVHVISLVPSPPLEELARRTQGSFRLAQSESEACKLIEEAHIVLVARFQIGCTLPPDARELSLKVFDPAGWGETTLSL